MIGGILRVTEDRLAEAQGQVLQANRARDEAIAARDAAIEDASASLQTSQAFRRENLDLRLQLAAPRQAALPVQVPGVRVGPPFQEYFLPGARVGPPFQEDVQEPVPPPLAREENKEA